VGEKRGSPLAEPAQRFRAIRRELEQSVLPLATSLDGRRFSFQASLHDLAIQVGGYVVLDDGSEALGQVTALGQAVVDGPDVTLAAGTNDLGAQTQVRIRMAQGEGVVLGGAGRPFHDAAVRPAEPSEVGAWLGTVRPARATLEIGEVLLAPGVPLELDATGFTRHTFMCGQSGSGKTYSLGLLLERILLETSLRIVVLDPNSDYVRLAELRADADSTIRSRYRESTRELRVRSAGGRGEDRLRLRFGELDPATQAAVLRLDPIADRAEYAELLSLVEASGRAELGSLFRLATEGGDEAKALALRARNLGLDGWGVWARSDAGSLVEQLQADDWRCLVVDLGSLGSPDEQALAAEATLEALWRNRATREPVLLVVDEAHNICPQAPEDGVTARSTRHAVAIAGEGRKFGLYVLLSTQRPQKVHENVISQCDNLILMRMNSEADLAVLRESFSFVPWGLLERATAFAQGEALVAGKLVSHPAFARFGRRLSEEGGADVPADWAAPA
jgi:uncharacterized protein